MKKIFSGVFLAIFLLTTASTTYAASSQINIDGVAISSDVKPEFKNNRAMVPIRVISENLGARIEATNSKITLTKDDIKVVVTLNSSTVEKNGKKMLLDAKPYMNHNRVFVPLRFIAETFSCTVKYSNSTVTIQTKPLFINGVQVKAMTSEYHMTMGGVVQQINSNVYNQNIYNEFVKNKGTKVEAPAHFSWTYDIDTPGSYYKNGQYDFIDNKGNSLVRYDVYSLNSSFPAELLTGYPKVLIHDASKDEWYLFSNNAIKSIDQLMNTANKNGFQKTISNTVV